MLLVAVAACALLWGSSRVVAQTAPAAPTNVTVTATTNTLTVTWSAPADTGGSAIEAYDVRYIESDTDDADKLIDANWTLVEAWSAGALSYTVTGLYDGTGYDVQVRAENATEEGDWSGTRTATTTDHANTRTAGSLVALGTTVAGRISSDTDSDYFRIVLTADTDLWAYTTGDVDTTGELYSEQGIRLLKNEHGFFVDNPLNFSLRYRMQAGTYYLRVYVETGTSAGRYTLHTQAATDPGNSIETATTVVLNSITPGLVGPSWGDGSDDFFKLVLTEATDVWVMLVGDVQAKGAILDSNGDLVARSLDSSSHSYLLRNTGFNNRIIGDRTAPLPAGTYYIKVELFLSFKGIQPYTMVIRTGSNPGSTTATAVPLTLLRPEVGRISDANKVEYFSLTLDEARYIGIELLDFTPALSAAPRMTVLDQGTEISLFAITREQFRTSGGSGVYGRLWGRLAAGTYHIKVEAPPSNFPGMYLISAYEDTEYAGAVEKCTSLTTPVSDPWYGCQWHLNNTNQLGPGGGQDINVAELWATNKGEGINVAVVDTGLRSTHEDLADNVDTSRNAIYAPGGDIENPREDHGTKVAGLIAARDNNVGVRGVAPRATIYAYDLLESGRWADDVEKAEAMAHERAVTAVYNNSWGSGQSAIPKTTSAVLELARREGVANGYGGKGAFYVWSAGNGHRSDDNTNLDELKNSFAVTTVCGIGYNDRRAVYSDMGASLWVCAPSGDGSGGTRHMTTTDPGNRYTDAFAGTSAAAPVVSGVAALIRAENTDLTWRDVKLILANSARKNDATSRGWEQGGVKYGSTTDRYSFNHSYGFGAVDAGAAVALARTWTNLPPMREAEVPSSTVNLRIPDAVEGSTSTTVSSSVTFDSYIEFVEFVEINTAWDHAFIRDLEIELVSPTGAVSRIVPAIDKSNVHELFYFQYEYQSPFRFGSSRHLGEPAAGEWTLRITDHNPGHVGALKSWSLKIYGHGVRPATPTDASASQSGTSVTINWTAPTDTGPSAITGYDLRYIRSDASDGNWTGRSAVATSDASPFTLTGLETDVQYDLQVRAVNSAGAGPWSDTFISIKPDAVPAPPASTSVSAGHERLHVTWRRPNTGSALVEAYDVRSIRSDATDRADIRWDVVDPAWSSGDGALRYTIGSLTNGVSYDAQVRATNATGDGPWSALTTGAPAVQNRPPAFPAATAIRSHPETPYWGRLIGEPVEATDPDGDAVTYSVVDATDFVILPNGQLVNWEPLDRAVDTSHTVTVGASDGKDANGDPDADAGVVDTTIVVTIDVTAGFAPLRVVGLDRPGIAENFEGSVATYTAIDPEGAATTFTWSLEGTDAEDFTISQMGDLSFRTPPDADRPADDNRNNWYVVIVRATAGEQTGALRVLVQVLGVDETPVLRGPTTIDFPENSTDWVAHTHGADDPEFGYVTWSVGGPDGAAFDINPVGRVLTFKTPPDYETKNEYQITLEAFDQMSTGTLDVTVNITNEEEGPVITGPSSVTRSEGGPTTVGTYVATDPEGDDTRWTGKSGADRGYFAISEAGVLSFIEPPDLTARPDADRDGKYIVGINAADTNNYRGNFWVTVTVTSVNEPPVISGSSAVNFAENGTGAVGTYTAADPEDDTVIWSLTGADAARFGITGGALTFTSSPNYEDARDAGGGNVYNVTVNASDGEAADTHDVAVTVTNADEAGTLALSSGQPQVGTALTATLSDLDIVQSTTWKWERSAGGSTWTVIATATTSSYTPASGDLNHKLRVTADYSDGHGSGKSLTATPSNTVEAAPVMNTAPTFDSSTATREVAENSPPDTPVGLAVTADDTENDRLTYTIPGTSFFTINGASGQIRVALGALLNHEAAPSHDVTVRAADPSDLSATIAVTINVGDVNEAPVAGDEVGADAVTTDEDTPVTIAVLDNDSDPETDTLQVTGIATQPRDGTATVDADRQTVTYEPATNRHGAADFTYTVSDGRLTDTGSVAVVIRAVNDAPDLGAAVVTRSVSEGATIGADVGARVVATDPDHAALTYGLSLNGSSDFAIHPDTGQITVAVDKLDREDTASYSGTVTATDGSGASGDVPITITLTDVDEAPVADPDNVTTNEDTPISINVLDNDHDPEGRPLRASLGADRPRNGTATVERDGAIRYTPNADFHGNDGFTYTVSDGTLTATGLVSVQVDAVNDWPAFAAATATLAVSESAQPGDKVGQPLAVTDRDDDPLSYSLAGTDSDAFDIGVKSGQVILASGTRLNHAAQSSYEVVITASDGHGGNASVEVTITVTMAANQDPEFPASETGARSVDENAASGISVGAAVGATDTNRDTLTYTLVGTDSGSFTIDEHSGQIRTSAALDHETQSSYSLTVNVSDGKDENAEDDDSVDDTVAVTITVNDVNEPPTVSGPAHVQFPEGGRVSVGFYAVTDRDDGDTFSWDLQGSDRALFEVDATGMSSELRFKTAPDYDTPRSDTYHVTVRVSDSGSLRATRTVRVDITDLNEPLVITENSAVPRTEIDFRENATGTVQSLRASDPEGARVSWSLAGSHQDHFKVESGRLTFKPDKTPNYEAQSSYQVEIRASDGTNSATHDLDVSIVNLDERGMLELSHPQPQVNTIYTATHTDSDGILSETWSWHRSTDRSNWAVIDNATSNSYVPVGADLGSYLRATVDYEDGFSASKQRRTVSGQKVKPEPGANTAPMFASASISREVDENSRADTRVGAPVAATDAEDTGLSYSLSGSDLFVINQSSGQIAVAQGAGLNHEATPSIAVTLTASDPSTSTGTTTVTITINDVNEPPDLAPDQITTEEDTEATTNVLSNDSDPDSDALTLSSIRCRRGMGAVSFEVGGVITFKPKLNAHGDEECEYRAGDGRYSGTALLRIAITPVNDAPVFSGQPITRRVAETSAAENEVGRPVAASDADGDVLTYSMFSPEFEIDSSTGQITVAAGTKFDAAMQPSYSVTVEADDGNGGRATAAVTITVTTGPIPSPGSGGGGGGGGPSPSVIDFEWTVSRDIDELDSGHDKPSGLWSDGVTLWLLENGDGADDAIYAYDLKTGERVEEREFELDEANRAPRGVWSDRTTIWVSDSGQNRLFAQDLATGERLPERDIALAGRNRDVRGIWSDDETMWVLDGGKNALFAYNLESGELLAEYALDSTNDDPRGISSDGVTGWVSDHGAKWLFAYRLPAPEGPAAEDAEPQDLERVIEEEFRELSGASNNSPRGIWSDGDFMYVADESDARVYTYNMPNAIDARLATLALSGVDIGEFSPGTTGYEGAPDESVTVTTVEASALQRRTSVDIDPPDADEAAEGHQLALKDLTEVTVTVTSADGSRTKTYRVRLGPEGAAGPAAEEVVGPAPEEEAAGSAASCLRGGGAVGFSLVVSAGGSFEDLVACAEDRNVAALYVLDGGAFVSYILGAPAFVNQSFAGLFADGVPALTPLVARSDGPATADPVPDAVTRPLATCLQGEIVEGFNLVLYEGGSVGDLEACAEGAGLASLYVLDDGVWVSHILGAPAFVNVAFRDLYAAGVPVITPLVGKRN